MKPTPPYIYPFWFNNDADEAVQVLTPLMREDGFIFNFENFYVAYATDLGKIIGIVCAIDPTTNLNYDYSKLESVNHNYEFTTKNYIKSLIDEVREKKYMYLVNVCIDTEYREKRVGYRMLKYFIDQMYDAGFDEIGFDCLMHNMRAKNLYHSLGFKETGDGIGFDGTDHSTVEIVFFKKKKSKFTPADFEMKQDADVKIADFERECYLFKAMAQNKEKYEQF